MTLTLLDCQRGIGFGEFYFDIYLYFERLTRGRELFIHRYHALCLEEVEKHLAAGIADISYTRAYLLEHVLSIHSIVGVFFLYFAT